MLIADFSQLAVMTGPRDLKGAVSWKSIAKARNAHPDAQLSAAIVRAEAVPHTADLISMLPVIERQEFVFVHGSDRCITGIVTLADVVEAYGQMASPFFMIGRIDKILRRMIEDTFTMKKITPLVNPDGLRGINSYDRLTMGAYQRILENPDCWAEFGWPLDRKIFCNCLERSQHFVTTSCTSIMTRSQTTLSKCYRTSSTCSRIMATNSSQDEILKRCRRWFQRLARWALTQSVGTASATSCVIPRCELSAARSLVVVGEVTRSAGACRRRSWPTALLYSCAVRRPAWPRCRSMSAVIVKVF